MHYTVCIDSELNQLWDFVLGPEAKSKKLDSTTRKLLSLEGNIPKQAGKSKSV